MPRKSPAKPRQDDQEQSKRFIETGTKLGADKDGEALGVALKKVTASPPKGASPKSRSTP